MKAVVLGSGFTNFVSQFKILSELLYEEFLDFEIKTLEGHERKLFLAELNGENFVILSGRLHYYEGFSPEQIVRPIEFALEKYNLTELWISSASGAFQKEIKTASWYQVEKFISLPALNHLRTSFGDHVSNSCETIKDLDQVSYAFQQGPSLGTLAEYKMLSDMGADLVGMSMWPEYAFCKSKNLKTSMLSLPVCNYFPLIHIVEPSHEEVIAQANEGAIKLANLFKSQMTISS